MLRRLLCNPTFVFVSLAGTMEGWSLANSTISIKIGEIGFKR